MIKDIYETYEKALELLNMKTLYDRRQALSFNFAKRCLKTDKVKHFFPNNQNDLKGTRNILPQKGDLTFHHWNKGKTLFRNT